MSQDPGHFLYDSSFVSEGYAFAEQDDHDEQDHHDDEGHQCDSQQYGRAEQRARVQVEFDLGHVAPGIEASLTVLRSDGCADRRGW